jgi:hypothetical protein
MADYSYVTAAAEALQRAREEVSNLTVEGDESRRERLISLLNTVGEGLGDIRDQLDDQAPAEADHNPNENRVESLGERVDAEAPTANRKNRR